MLTATFTCLDQHFNLRNNLFNITRILVKPCRILFNIGKLFFFKQNVFFVDDGKLLLSHHLRGHAWRVRRGGRRKSVTFLWRDEALHFFDQTQTNFAPCTTSSSVALCTVPAMETKAFWKQKSVLIFCRFRRLSSYFKIILQTQCFNPFSHANQGKTFFISLEPPSRSISVHLLDTCFRKTIRQEMKS